jgi:hypothetical protein
MQYAEGLTAEFDSIVVVENGVVGGQEVSIGVGDGNVESTLPHLLYSTYVVPVTVRLDHSLDAKCGAEFQEPFVFVGGIDENSCTRLGASDDVHIVGKWPNYDLMNGDTFALVYLAHTSYLSVCMIVALASNPWVTLLEQLTKTRRKCVVGGMI